MPGDDVERTVVKTYVPRYQKERWREHADRLEMTQSEFVRSMVQAGRRTFDPADEEPDSGHVTPGGIPLEDRVLDVLDEESFRSWGDLVAALATDLEDPLEEVLQSLQAENRVQHSGRHDGYTLVEDDG